jgi:hypothetical protein
MDVVLGIYICGSSSFRSCWSTHFFTRLEEICAQAVKMKSKLMEKERKETTIRPDQELKPLMLLDNSTLSLCFAMTLTFVNVFQCFCVVVGGPKAACMGCAGFAAFSVVIEKFLERHQ